MSEVIQLNLSKDDAMLLAHTITVPLMLMQEPDLTESLLHQSMKNLGMLSQFIMVGSFRYLYGVSQEGDDIEKHLARHERLRELLHTLAEAVK